jgi:Zn-dependent protease
MGETSGTDSDGISGARKDSSVLAGTKLFKIRGIPIFLHWTAWLVAALVAVNVGAVGGIVVGAIAAVLFMVSILLHELSHALTAHRFDVPTERITLWGLGGAAQLGAESPTPRAEGWIAVAGPLASVALAGIGIGSAYGLAALGVHGVVPGVLFWLGLTNALLAAFNLLPGAPLDGGRLVAAWRWSRHGDRFRARDEAGRAGQVVGWAIAIVGFYLLMRGIGSFLLPMTGVFIAAIAKVERQASVAARRLDGLRVSDLAWYGIAQAPADTDAETMWWQRSRLGGAGAVAVTDDSGGVTGVVVEDRLGAVPEGMRPFTRLTQLMVPVAAVAKAAPDEPLSTAVARLHPLAPVITVWRDGRLVAVVPPNRLREKLMPPA